MAESARQKRMRELGLLGDEQPEQSQPAPQQQPETSIVSARQKRMMELGVIEDTRLAPSKQGYSMVPRPEPELPASQQGYSMASREPQLPGRDIPIIGDVLQGLDWFSQTPVQNVIADVGEMVYTPGGTIKNIAGATQALGGAATKLMPNLSAKLSSSLGGRVAQGALREGALGAPLTSANYLAQGNTQLDEAAEQGLYGAAFGGALGAAGPLLGKGLKALGQRVPESKVGQLINSFDPPPNSNELPYKPYEDLSLLSRADSNTQRLPQQGARLDGAQEVVDSVKRRDAFNSPEQQMNRADSVLEQYRLTMQNKYDPNNLGQDVRSSMSRKEKTQMAQYEQNLRNVNNEQPAATEPILAPVEQPVPRRELPIPEIPPANIDYDLLNQAMPKQPPVQPPRVAPAAIPDAPVNTRANYKNQVDNGNFSDDLQTQIRNQDQSYDQLPNSEALSTVNKEILDDLPGTEARFHADDKGGAEQTVRGYRLMQEFDQAAARETDPIRKESFLQRAVNTANKLAADLTRAGQQTQAAKVLGRLSPEGQLLNLTRTAERNGQKVTPEVAEKFLGEAKKAQSMSGAGKNANAFTEVLDRIAKNGGKATPEDLDALSKYVNKADEVIPAKPKEISVKDDLPREFKDVRKRDKVVSYFDDKEQAAWDRIKARGNRLNSLPLDEWADYSIIIASKIAKGTIKASTHAEDMVKLFGEEIRPVATQVFQKAQSLVKTVSRSGAAEGNLERANEALRRMTGEAAAEKAIVEETANHVRKLIADAKAGKLDPADVQKLRDYSDEIVDTIKDKKPGKLPTQEERFLQSVKSLAKKVAKLETEKVPADQANREVSSLLRQITKIADEGKPIAERQPLDNKALSKIAYDVLEKTKPNQKEKILEQYIRQMEKKKEPLRPSDIENLRELAKNVTRLSKDQGLEADIAMQKILNSYEKSSVWDKVQAMRYMAMLANSSTQLINALSGPVMASTGVASDILGTMIDIAMNKVLKTPRTTTLYGTNPLKFTARYFKNLKTGGKAGAQGVNPAGIQGTNEIRGLSFKSLYNPLGLVERGLGAAAKGPDFATYKSVFDAEMIKQGRVDAINKKIKGKENIENHIQQFINDPPEAASLQADRIGKNTTFQRSDTTGGKLANYLSNAPTVAQAPIRAIFPFVRTPVNIASTAVTMTPAGIIKGLYQLTSKSQATQREAIRTLSLGVTGTGIGAVGYYLSQLGVLTGANDSGDKEADAIKEQAGEGKYRINTSAILRYIESMVGGEGDAAAEKAAKYQEGDKQIDYNKWQPIAFPLAIGASIGRNKDKPTLDAAKSVGEDAFGSFFGMSTLKGAQDVFQPQFGGTVGEKALGVPSRIAASFFKSFSPSALAQEARRQDPIVRKTTFNEGIIKDTASYFKSRTPGLSQSMPPSKTTLGKDKLNPPGIVGSYLNPYKSDVASYSEAAVIISKLIDRTGDLTIAPSAPEKNVKGVKVGYGLRGEQVTIALTPERYAKLQEDVGQGIIKGVMAINPSLSDAKKIEKIKEVYSKVKDKERDKVKRENGIRVTN